MSSAGPWSGSWWGTVFRLLIAVCPKHIRHLYNWIDGEGGGRGTARRGSRHLGMKPEALCVQGSPSTPELQLWLQPLARTLQADCFIFTLANELMYRASPSLSGMAYKWGGVE